MEFYKRYVDVVVLNTAEGGIKPLCLVWSNGRKYPIDKVYTQQRRASRVGGIGICFECRFGNARRNLFYEENRHRWFIESEKP
jgi:hypothetical protein